MRFSIIAILLSIPMRIYGEAQQATLPFASVIDNVMSNIVTYTLPACTVTLSPVTAAALQAQFDAGGLDYGETLCIPNNAILTGQFDIVARSWTSGWITVRAVTVPGSNGVRAARALAGTLPIIQNSASNSYALSIDRAAKRWRFVGLDFTTSVSNAEAGIVEIGAYGATNNTGKDILFDRVLVHGKQPASGLTPYTAAAGIRSDLSNVAVTNSSIYGINDDGDAQAFSAINAAGGIVLQNNYLEASGENVMFGGSKSQNVITADIVLRGNHFIKLVSQRSNPTKYTAKNLLEFKEGLRALVEGNYFEDSFSNSSGQFYAIVVKSTNQSNASNTAAWAYAVCCIQSSHVTVRYNKFDKVNEGFSIGKATNEAWLGGTHFTAVHNLFTQFGAYNRHIAAGTVDFMQTNLPKNVSGQWTTLEHIYIAHNTLGSWAANCGTASPQNGCKPVWLSALQVGDRWGKFNGFSFKNNVWSGPTRQTNNAGAIPDAKWNAYVNVGAGALVTHNLGIATTDSAGIRMNYVNRPPNFAPASNWSSMFVNAAGGNYALAAPYNLTGDDATVVGANMTVLNACAAGAQTSWTGSGQCPSDSTVSVSLTANGTAGGITVASAATVTLAWFSSNTTACSAPWTALTTTSGQQVVNPTVSTLYTVTCNGVARSVQVNIETVDVQPPIYNLPTDGATNVSLTPMLTWQVAGGAAKYDVKFGTANPPTTTVSTNQTTLTYSPATLTASTTYRWQVVAKNADASQTAAGQVWSFTTGATLAPPGAFTYVVPTNGATNVANVNAVISWNPSTGADSYSIYFGTVNPPPLAVTGASAIEYTQATLDPATQYFWKVEAINPAGTVAGTGGVQSFTTVAGPTGCPSAASYYAPGC